MRSLTGIVASALAQARRFALTIAALLCLLVERTIALDAFGAPGAILLTLLRTYLAPFNAIHHALFRLSIAVWTNTTPTWWNWLRVPLAFLPYVIIDLILGGARADHAAVRRAA